MPKFEDGDCRGITSRGPCGCTNFVIGAKTVSHTTYVSCANEVGGRTCGHADATHRVKVIKGQVVPWETAEADVKALPRKSVDTPEFIPGAVSGAPGAVSGAPGAAGGLSVKEARAILRRHEVPGVGERGRLSPTQMKKAAQLKESENG